MNTISLVVVVTGLHTPLWKLILLSAVLVSQVTVLLLWPHIGMLREGKEAGAIRSTRTA